MKGPTTDFLTLPVPRTFDLSHVEPEHFAAALDKNPQRIFQFVRDHIAYEVYPGCLRGPRGTLLAMAGNSVDRAALVAALLQQSGQTVRFVRGSLPEAQALELVASMWAKRLPLATAKSKEEPSPAFLKAIDNLEKSVKRDYATIRAQLKKLDNLPAPAPEPSLAELAKEAEDHYWVQWQKDKQWIDLDPSFADAQPGQTFAMVAKTWGLLPEEIFHRVELRVLLEETPLLLEGNQPLKPAKRVLLTHKAKAMDLSGVDLVLVHQPENWQGPARDVQSALSTVIAKTGRIKPVLLAGPAAVLAGASFHYQMPAQEGLGGLEGLLGGLGTRTAVPIATAETVEFVFIAPGGKKETSIREIFDRVGPARRASGKLLMADELRVKLAIKEDDTRGIFSFFFATGRIDMAQLHGSAAPPGPAAKDKTTSIRDPLRWVNISLVALSDGLLERLGKTGDAVVRFYPDSPRLIIAEFNTGDRRFGLDLRRDRVRAVAPAGPAVFFGRVLRGVVEGCLETVLAEYLMSDLDRSKKGAAVVSTSALFERAAAAGVGVALFDNSRPMPNKVPEDAHARVKHALAAGSWVIAPERTLAVAGRERFAWWQIDPRSGETIAVTDEGLHQAATTYVLVGKEKDGQITVAVETYVGEEKTFGAAFEMEARYLLRFLANWRNIESIMFARPGRHTGSGTIDLIEVVARSSF